MARKTSRRDFLKGKSAADAVADAVENAPPAEAGAYVIQVSRRAMACEFEVQLNAGQYDHGTETALEALDLVDKLEDQFSVFRETSELCLINRTAGRQPVEVEPHLFGLLQLAVRLYEETDGAFDVTSAPLWEAWGFARRKGAVPDQEQLAEALSRVGSRWLELDAEGKTVRFGRPGVQLNLGSIGKGHALDRCAEKLFDAGIEDFLIHGGRSSVTAHGRQTTQREGTEQLPAGWRVGLRHPLRADRRLAEIRLCNRSLATSGSQAQSFVHQGRRYGHILDPRTGRPAEGVLSATAIAPIAAVADALSTAFYVMGPEKTLEYCLRRPDMSAVLVCPVRHSGGIEIHSAGLTDDDWTIL